MRFFISAFALVLLLPIDLVHAAAPPAPAAPAVPPPSLTPCVLAPAAGTAVKAPSVTTRTTAVFMAPYDSTNPKIAITPSLPNWCDSNKTDPNLKWIYVSQLPLSSVDSNGGRLGTPASAAATQLVPASASNLIWYKTADGNESGPQYDAAAETLFVDPLVAFNPAREYWSNEDNQRVIIAYIDTNTMPMCPTQQSINLNVAFSETERQTVLSQNLSSLIQTPSLTPAAAKPSKTESTLSTYSIAPTQKLFGYCLYASAYTMSQLRATLGITITPPTDTAIATGQPKTIVNVLTGPAEHLFVTVDALYQPMASFAYPKTGPATEQDVPNNPMLGLNYLIGGDLNDPATPWNDLFGVKLLASPDHVKNLLGLGMGYLIPWNFSSASTSTGTFMVYVARMRSISATGNRTERWRWGISYNLVSFGGSGGGSGGGKQNGGS
jgi:hypothetical protein